MSTPPSGHDPDQPPSAGEGYGSAPDYGVQPGSAQPADGAPPPGTGYGYAPLREHAPGAVASLVLGILGLFTIPLVLSIVAVVLGNQSRRATEAEPHRYTDQLGHAGRILGWIGIGLAVLGLLVVLALLAFLLPVGRTVISLV